VRKGLVGGREAWLTGAKVAARPSAKVTQLWRPWEARPALLIEYYAGNMMIIMSPSPTERKEASHRRILEAADDLMKAQGVESTSVAEVMARAGLTVGGFYAHFPSKEAMVQEALLFGLTRSVDRMLAAVDRVDDPKARVRALIREYLAQAEDPDLAHACPMTLLLPDLARADRQRRNAFGAHTGALLERIAERFPEIDGMTRREAALVVYTSCAGAVSVARAVASPDARRRIIGSTERMLVRALSLV
jgi:TetR/AcrR family transcriptional repressor of nem operon